MKLQLRQPILRSHPNGNELKNNGNELRNKLRLKCLPDKGQKQLFFRPINSALLARVIAMRSIVKMPTLQELFTLRKRFR
jgi:hypothetical protein